MAVISAVLPHLREARAVSTVMLATPCRPTVVYCKQMSDFRYFVSS